MEDLFALTLTQSAAVNQNIIVYWEDRQSATYNAGTLDAILTDENAQFSYITLSDTGEIILDADRAYIEMLTDFYGDRSYIITHDGLDTAYTWTAYNGIRCHNDFESAYRYLMQNGFIS